jgi:hypothetical protein
MMGFVTNYVGMDIALTSHTIPIHYGLKRSVTTKKGDYSYDKHIEH